MAFAFRTAALLFMLSAFGTIGDGQSLRVENTAPKGNFEAEFWDRIRAKNWGGVADMLDPEIIAANRGQILNGKSAVLEHVKRIELSNFSYTDVTIRQDGDILVVAFRMNVVATGNGEPEPMNWRMISVWRQKERTWLMISHAAIPAADAMSR